MLSSLLLELDCYIRMYSYASIPLKAFKPQYMNKLCSVPVISTPLLSLLSINSPAANYQLAVLKKYPVLANILNLCTQYTFIRGSRPPILMHQNIIPMQNNIYKCMRNRTKSCMFIHFFESTLLHAYLLRCNTAVHL